jgi:hypothetical protein
MKLSSASGAAPVAADDNPTATNQAMTNTPTILAMAVPSRRSARPSYARIDAHCNPRDRMGRGSR